MSVVFMVGSPLRFGPGVLPAAPAYCLALIRRTFPADIQAPGLFSRTLSPWVKGDPPPARAPAGPGSALTHPLAGPGSVLTHPPGEGAKNPDPV